MQTTERHGVDEQQLPPYGAALRDQVLGSFQGPIQPVPVSFTYRLGLILVSLVMVLLPLIYLSLVALAGYGVYYHATHHLSWLQSAGRLKAALVAYGTPLFVGVVLLLFMLKPLFARPARGPAPRSLKPDQEPVLFAFVERLCATVGAPMPRRIDVDCQVNASASLRRGLLSLFSRDLVLTIGLPLAAGLSLQQLAGVLAHELGHFAQSTGMRLSYIVRRINHWFSRVVYERDSWDEKLLELVRSEDHWVVSMVVGLSRGAIWLTRRLLWALMWVGHAVSSFMMRQMEFDADRYETRLAGTRTFEATSHEISRLSLAFQQTMSDLSWTWQEGRLSDDLPALVRVNRSRLSDDVLHQLRRQAEQSRTGWLDTHPADRDRIASARREGTQGVFRSHLPATALFRNFGQLAQEGTREYYEELLGQAVTPEQLQPVGHLVAKKEQSDQGIAALRRVFQGIGRILPLPAQVTTGVQSLAEGRQTLTGEREALLRAGTEYPSQWQQLKEQRQVWRSCQQVAALLECGLQVRSADFGLKGADTAAGVAAQSRFLERQIARLESALKPVEALAVQRLEHALAALELLAAEQPQLAPRHAGGQRWLRAAAAISDKSANLQRIGHQLALMAELAGQLETKQAEQVGSRLAQEMGLLQAELRQFETDWAGLPYPFDHADPSMTQLGYVLPEGQDLQELRLLFAAASQLLERTQELYARLLGALAECVELAETGLGLEPLPQPGGEVRAVAA